MKFLTRIKSIFLFSKKKKQIKFVGKSLFGKSDTRIRFGRRKNPNFIIISMVFYTALFSSLVNADTVADIQNGSFSSAHKGIIYSVNSNTGKATQLSVVPDNIGGVDTYASIYGINSLAINTQNGLLYFASNKVSADNKALFAYNMRNNTFSVIESDMTTRNVILKSEGMGSGGAFFEPNQRRLYFGLEDGLYNDSYIYSIAVDFDGQLLALSNMK